MRLPASYTPFNRTIIELKQIYKENGLAVGNSFNRTIIELKLYQNNLSLRGVLLLIGLS